MAECRKFLVVFCLVAVSPLLAPVRQATGGRVAEEKTLTLERAVMCESIENYAPRYTAIAFSIGARRISCFTAFNPVPRKTHIFHCWYHRDKLSTKIKLYLKPPRWSTFSTIQLRETDKGPWRLEIKDADGKLIRVLRFSITD